MHLHEVGECAQLDVGQYAAGLHREGMVLSRDRGEPELTYCTYPCAYARAHAQAARALCTCTDFGEYRGPLEQPDMVRPRAAATARHDAAAFGRHRPT